MKMIIIDTSREIGICALYEKDIGYKTVEFDSKSQQKVLISSIDSLIKEVTITHVAVCVGPGSFTGTRIGVITAKTFSYAQNLPLFPYNSLLPFHTPGTLTLQDGKNGFVFVFDGHTLEKIPYASLAHETRALFSPNPENLLIPARQAHYQIEPLLTLSAQFDCTIFY